MIKRDAGNQRLDIPLSLVKKLSSAEKNIGNYEDKDLKDIAFQTRITSTLEDIDHDFKVIVDRIRHSLLTKPYHVHITGLRPSDQLIFIGLCTALGELVDPYNQTWSTIIREIQPSTDRRMGKWGILNEHLHTDGTDWEDPNDLTSLFCVSLDQFRDGQSRIYDVDTLLDQLSKSNKDMITILRGNLVPWKLADALGGQIIYLPILNDLDEIRWMRYSIDEASALSNNELKIMASTLDDFEHFLDATKDLEYKIELSAGDIIFINNKKSLHARTPIRYPEQSKRILLRTKVMLRTF